MNIVVMSKKLFISNTLILKIQLLIKTELVEVIEFTNDARIKAKIQISTNTKHSNQKQQKA